MGMKSPAILILTYKRMQYLTRTLDSVVGLPTAKNYELYVSQDGSDPDMSSLVSHYAPVHKLTLLHHERRALMVADQTGTAYLAQHYKWILDKLFFEKHHSHVVIMEDDMLVSPDFLTLFEETAYLLDTDETLMCVSSWNDNGMTRLVADATRLLRTDYFPGLGWMMNAALWREISEEFPLDQWDHFMRLDTVSRGRDCLIPEVARNHNIGEEGTNMGQGFYQRYLAPVAWNDQPVSFQKKQDGATETKAGDGATTKQEDVRSLEHMRSSAFEASMHRTIASAKYIGRFADPPVTMALSGAQSVAAVAPEKEVWLVTYERDQYPSLAAQFGLLPVPRSIHKGTLSLRLGEKLVFFADIKISPYLPEELKFRRDPSLVAKISRQGESCTDACGRDGLSCRGSHFQFINECSQLKQHFACAKGCRGGVAGEDVPNYVDNPSKPELFGYCLTTEDVSVCGASHWSASRLCPCAQPQP